MENRECPVCKKQGHDTHGNHLFMMSDGNRWMCNRKEYHPDGEAYYEDAEQEDQDELKEQLARVQQLISTPDSGQQSVDIPVSTSTGIPSKVTKEYRGIEPATFEKFKTEGMYVGSVLTELQHELIECGTGRVVCRKIRKLPKDFFCTSKTKGISIQLFGQEVFPRAKRLLIVEGEMDAMSAWQMLQKWRVAVVSLPTGANIKALTDNQEYLKGFKEVYVAVDDDEAGQKVSRDIANLIPTAKFLKMSEKDANDMLTKGKVTEFVSAFWDADIYQPETIVRIRDIMDKILVKPTMGVEWPWPSLTDATYGRNPGEGMYVGAGVKIGKSEFINELVAFDVKAGRKIGILKYEEPPHKTAQRVAGKIDGIFYHKPKVPYNMQDLERTSLAIDPYLYMYPAFGKATWETTREYIRYAALNGCTTIIIDPVTKLTNHLDSSKTEEQLRLMSDELACMAQDMGFFYIVTCHLKAPQTGPPHEMGGRVQSNQFRGSRAMMENCYYMLGIQRNKDPNLPEEERNTSTFVLLEDRNFGNSMLSKVFYDKDDQSYQEKALSF